MPVVRDGSTMQVVDTNVIAYLLLQGDRSTTARALFEKHPDWRSDSFASGGASANAIARASYDLIGDLLSRGDRSRLNLEVEYSAADPYVHEEALPAIDWRPRW